LGAVTTPEHREARADSSSADVTALEPPVSGDEWLALTSAPLPTGAAIDWATRPDCGAVVFFSGNVRDHAEGRTGVTHLDYEAYDTEVGPKLEAIATEMRRRWPEIGRLALVHRSGVVALGESAVIVVVSAPHRDEAFAAARFGIDTLKSSVPIWKREVWDGGESWGVDAQHITAVDPARPPQGDVSSPVASEAGG
jgi:molybdopterin synthase catalytic subunit